VISGVEVGAWVGVGAVAGTDGVSTISLVISMTGGNDLLSGPGPKVGGALLDELDEDADAVAAGEEVAVEVDFGGFDGTVYVVWVGLALLLLTVDDWVCDDCEFEVGFEVVCVAVGVTAGADVTTGVAVGVVGVVDCGILDAIPFEEVDTLLACPEFEPVDCVFWLGETVGVDAGVGTGAEFPALEVVGTGVGGV
jgi:hypothetical protein